MISRRLFLKFLAAAASSVALPSPTQSKELIGVRGTTLMDMDTGFYYCPYVPPLIRSSYVKVGQMVSYIGPAGNGFIGSCLVTKVGEFDGMTGYQIKVDSRHQFPGLVRAGFNPVVYSDLELADFSREVPKGFWHDQANVEKYPNVHTYVRTKRYGETVAQAIDNLSFFSDFSKFKS
jgi:hypothetical protein